MTSSFLSGWICHRIHQIVWHQKITYPSPLRSLVKPWISWIGLSSIAVAMGLVILRMEEMLHHQKDGWNPINSGIKSSTVSTGAGFLPSTVCWCLGSLGFHVCPIQGPPKGASHWWGDPRGFANAGAPPAALGIGSAVSDVYLEQRWRLARPGIVWVTKDLWLG